jgi:hypothetical protein
MRSLNVGLRIAIVDNQVNKLQTIVPVIRCHKGKGRNKRISLELDTLCKYVRWEVPSLEASVIEDLYSAFTNMLGLNVDDPATWCAEFECIFLKPEPMFEHLAEG